jgi:DNA-binding NtrC family response regulator
MENLVLFAQGDEITLEDLPAEYRVTTADVSPEPDGPWIPRPMAEIERDVILKTLEYTDGHRGKAASLLQIGLRTLQRKLKEYGEIQNSD